MQSNFMQLNYIITLEAPVLISSTVGDENIIMSEDFLPGSALLGMFASRYIAKYQLGATAHKNNDVFKKWFLSGDLFFLNGYKSNDDGVRALPSPESMQVPKGAEKDEASPFDLLFDDPEPQTEAIGNYCVYGGKQVEIISVAKQFGFHHQRTNQVLGRNEGGEIFNYECIKPFQQFKAAILGDKDDLDAFLKEFGREKFIGRIGRSKNTQYGRVIIDLATANITEVNELPGSVPIELDETELAFTLTCLSHLILLNVNGHSEVSATVFKQTLADAFAQGGLTIEPKQIDIKMSFVRPVVLENYISIWKARKPSVSGFQKGSCFLIQLQDLSDEATLEKIEASLERIQEQGLGIRRHEGFGRVAINWQQHLDKKEKILNITKRRKDDRDGNARVCPTGSPPEIAKTILRTVLYRYLVDRAREKGVMKQDSFNTKLPPGTQLSRLLAFTRKAKNEKDFVDMIKNLRDPAKNKLKACKSENETLFDFLSSSKLTQEGGEIHRLLRTELPKNTSEICQVIREESEKNQKLKQTLFEAYMKTFFTLMQKRTKKEGEDAHAKR